MNPTTTTTLVLEKYCEVIKVAEYINHKQQIIQQLKDAQNGGDEIKLALLLLVGLETDGLNDELIQHVKQIQPQFPRDAIRTLWREYYSVSKSLLAIRYCNAYEQLLNELTTERRLVTQEVADRNCYYLDKYSHHSRSRQHMTNMRGTGLVASVCQALRYAGVKLNSFQEKYDQWHPKEVKNIMQACFSLLECSVKVFYVIVNDTGSNITATAITTTNVNIKIFHIPSTESNNNKDPVIYLAFDGRTYHPLRPMNVSEEWRLLDSQEGEKEAKAEGSGGGGGEEGEREGSGEEEREARTPQQKALKLFLMIENKLCDCDMFKEELDSIPDLSEFINKMYKVSFFPDLPQCTVFYYACRSGRIDFVRVLLSVSGMVFNGVQAENGNTPLHVAHYRGHENIVLLLLYGGVEDRKIQNKRGDLPTLFRDGLSENVKNSINTLMGDITTLGQKEFRKKYDWVDVEERIQSPLEACARMVSQVEPPDEKRLDKLLQCLRPRINEPTSLGSTLLYSACRQGHKKVVEMLLKIPELEVDGVQTSYDGSTPLHVASWRGHVPVIALLLQKGATPSPTKQKPVLPQDEYKNNSDLPDARKKLIGKVYEAYDNNKDDLKQYIDDLVPLSSLTQRDEISSIFNIEIPPEYARLKRVWFKTNSGSSPCLLPLSVCCCLNHAMDSREGKATIFKYKPNLLKGGRWILKEWNVKFDRNVKEAEIRKENNKMVVLSWKEITSRYYYRAIGGTMYHPFTIKSCLDICNYRLQNRKTFEMNQCSMQLRGKQRTVSCSINITTRKGQAKLRGGEKVDIEYMYESEYDHIVKVSQPESRRLKLEMQLELFNQSFPSVDKQEELAKDHSEYDSVERAFHLTNSRKIQKIIKIHLSQQTCSKWSKQYEIFLGKQQQGERKELKYMWYVGNNVIPTKTTISWWTEAVKNGNLFLQSDQCWGPGIYFSLDANYAVNYPSNQRTKTICLAQVIAGQYMMHRVERTGPPPNPFDTMFDGMMGFHNRSWVYVCYNEIAALPTYIVTYE